LKVKNIYYPEDEHGQESIARSQNTQYLPEDQAPVYSRRKDPHCTRGTTRRQHNCRTVPREGINQNLCYRWSKEFLEAGKQRLTGNTQRRADSNEVKALRQENEQLKQLVAELALKNKVLKKSLTGLENLWDE
jgi:transposase-like protein